MKEQKVISEYLGRGMRFPGIFSTASGAVAVVEGRDKLNQRLQTILSTRKGEIGFKPSFGSRLHLLVFDIGDDILFDLAEVYAREAIEEWENAVTIKDVEVYMDEEIGRTNTLIIEIHYKVTVSPNVEGTYLHKIRFVP